MASRHVMEIKDISGLDLSSGVNFLTSFSEYLNGLDYINDIIETGVEAATSSVWAMRIKHKRVNTGTASLVNPAFLPVIIASSDAKIRINAISSTSTTVTQAASEADIGSLYANELGIVFTRNDYDECMFTFYYQTVSDSTRCSSTIIAECTDGGFAGVSQRIKNNFIGYSYSGTYTSSFNANRCVIAENDDNKYLIPFFTPYNIFKRVYFAVNKPQTPSSIYTVDGIKFVETGVGDYMSVALLYEE